MQHGLSSWALNTLRRIVSSLANFNLCQCQHVAVESEAADKMVSLIRDSLVNGDVSDIPSDESGLNLVAAEEFS